MIDLLQWNKSNTAVKKLNYRSEYLIKQSDNMAEYAGVSLILCTFADDMY